MLIRHQTYIKKQSLVNSERIRIFTVTSLSQVFAPHIVLSSEKIIASSFCDDNGKGEEEEAPASDLYPIKLSALHHDVSYHTVRRGQGKILQGGDYILERSTCCFVRDR